jgi:hypothetical protein
MSSTRLYVRTIISGITMIMCVQACQLASQSIDIGEQSLADVTEKPLEPEIKVETKESSLIWKTSWGRLYCQVPTQIAHLMKKNPIKVTHAQSRMWFKVEIKDIELQHSSFDELPYIHPAQIKSGDWLISPLSQNPKGSKSQETLDFEILLVEKPIPWIGNRAKRLGHCHVNQAFKAMSRLPVRLHNALIESLSLNLDKSTL